MIVLNRIRPIALTAPGGAVTHYSYDDPALPDRPTTTTDPRGCVRRLAWDVPGRLLELIRPDGKLDDYLARGVVAKEQSMQSHGLK